MFVIMAVRESDIYTLMLQTFPQHARHDVAENGLKMTKYRSSGTASNKSIFDLLMSGQALAMGAHRNHYTYLYRRKL